MFWCKRCSYSASVGTAFCGHGLKHFEWRAKHNLAVVTIAAVHRTHYDRPADSQRHFIHHQTVPKRAITCTYRNSVCSAVWTYCHKYTTVIWHSCTLRLFVPYCDQNLNTVGNMLLSPCSISTATWSSDHMLCTCIYNIFVTDHVTWGSQEFGLWVFCLVIAERDIPTCTISYIYQHKIMTDIQNHTKLIQIDGIRIISRFLDKVESFDCCVTEVDMQEINRRWIQNTSAYR